MGLEALADGRCTRRRTGALRGVGAALALGGKPVVSLLPSSPHSYNARRRFIEVALCMVNVLCCCIWHYPIHIFKNAVCQP